MPAECCKKFYAKLPEDEPVFTLAGRDKLAIATVNFWIEEAIKAGVNQDKIDRAYKHLIALSDFQNAHPERVKLPD
jgi:hypothetical protein